MINLNLFGISGLLIAVSYIPLFLFIFLKGKSIVSKIYALHLLMVLFWGIGSFLIATSSNPTMALELWKLSYTAVLFIPIFFYHSTNLLIKNKNKTNIVLIYAQGIIFTVLIFSGQLFTSVRLVYNKFYLFNNSIAYIASFIIWEIIVISSNINLIKHILNSSGEERKRTFLLFFAAVGFIGGTINFLPAINTAIYPIGNLLIPIHSFGISYAILRHRLFNLEFIFRKSIIYSILLAMITLLYLLLVTIIEKIIQKYYGYSSLVISALIILIIGILVIPLRNMIQRIIDYLFYRKSQIEILQENELLKQEIVQTDRLKSIATFARGMAHEIKNPLTSIKVFCEYLPQKIHDKEFLDTFIPLINKDANRINELVHDLLEYAKPSPPQLVNTDVHKIIESVLDALTARIIANKIHVIREFDPHIPLIPLDDKQIKQALLNIMLNSLEAMADKGTLKISTQLSNDPTKLTIKIVDNGCGISPEDLPRVFDPFFSKKDKGTGLGLSITHGIIKEHGGKIFVESIFKLGTTFRIEFENKLDTVIREA